MATSVIMQKNYSSNEPHLFALLFLPPFPMFDKKTFQSAHLQSNNKTTVRTCAFSSNRSYLLTRSLLLLDRFLFILYAVLTFARSVALFFLRHTYTYLGKAKPTLKLNLSPCFFVVPNEIIKKNIPRRVSNLINL